MEYEALEGNLGAVLSREAISQYRCNCWNSMELDLAGLTKETTLAMTKHLLLPTL